MKRLLLMAMLLSGCSNDPPEQPAEFRCINGKLHTKWGETWVAVDGRGYIGRPDGPISCTEAMR